MYSNSGDISILDSLEAKKSESQASGVMDVFVPLDITRLTIEGKTIVRKRFIAGNYIFIQAAKDDILRLREKPPFEHTLRFLHPSKSPTECIYVADDEVKMLRSAVEKLGGEAEYFVPRSKELVASDGVCILDGPFAGLKGVLESVKGHEGGCVIVSVGDVLAVRTPRIQPEDLQLLSLAKVSDGQCGSYTSRAYKKVKGLFADSQRLLEEKQTHGSLSDASREEARRLLLRFSKLQLSGKIRLMHAEAIYKLFLALDQTEGEVFVRFKNMLP